MRDDNFFALGGTSLLAIAVSVRLQSLGCLVAARTIHTAATVASLAERIARSGPLNGDSAAASSTGDAATAGQEEFWIAWKLGLPANGSRIARILKVTGTVPEPELWQSAWAELLRRHAALRTAFFADSSGKILWRTEEPASAPGISIDHCDSEDGAYKLIAERSNRGFALTEPPLARAGLVRVAEGGAETLFWFALHHSVADGYSARILQEELHALLEGRPLPPAPNGIAEASHAEQVYLASDVAGRDRAYWRDQFDALPATAFEEFPMDHRRPARPSGDGSVALVERLDSDTVSALERLAQARQVGLHAVLLTLLAAEAGRRDGRSHLVVGSGIPVRPPGAERAVGHFVNLLPMILPSGGREPLAEQIRSVHGILAEAVEHGGYPASLLFREFRQRHPHARPHSRTSLFDLSLTANAPRTTGDGTSGFVLAPRRLPGEQAHPAAGLDLAFSYEPLEDGRCLELVLAWNPDVYLESTARAWLGSFAAWLRWLAEDLRGAEGPLPALLPGEARLLDQWERGPTIVRPAKRFHEIFESLAASHPHRPAVVTDGALRSYAEVDAQANRIARTLAGRGVAHQEPVAVLTDCSADLPATVLGIWKASAAYLPLALDQPPERLAYMYRDAGARILIVLDGRPVPAALARAACQTLASEDWASDAGRVEIAGSPHDLAYIIYTSGTTGRPKGVLIQHDSLVNAALASGETFGLRPDDRISLVATPGFDASLWELGMGLLHGMTIVPVSRALRDDPWALKAWYKTAGVTVAFHSPSYLRISKQTPFDGLRVLLTGGEAPNHDDARHYAGSVDLWNAYGPAETTIFTCAERLSPDPDSSRPLAVGRPLANTRISIRRSDGAPAPLGALGEVWLGGAGLARGYLVHPELDGRRFVETPYGRFYRSGDLGRWTGDGRLELAGRLDDQVKLHGQRLEPGEIAEELRSHPAVEEAVVLADATAGDTRILRAFIRLRSGSGAPRQEEWRDYLGERLPAYMVPASVTPVAAMPLTSAGKIDRDALLRTVPEPGDGTRETPPRTEMEICVARVWREVLGYPVSREHNFFAQGGNSLLAVSLSHRLSQELARPVAARELFAAPTLAAFARRIEMLSGATAPMIARSDTATEGQREFYVAGAAGLDTRTFTIPVVRVVEGGTVPVERWKAAWARLVARHEALRTCFREDQPGRLLRATEPTVDQALETAVCADGAQARAHIRERQYEPFCMDTAPLWRAGLVEVAESGDHLFWLALHHSVGDGRSVGILMEELTALLRGESLPPISCDFAESAAREESYLAGETCTEDARYWSELLARQPDAAFEQGPLDHARSNTDRGGTHRFETRLDDATTLALKAIARECKTSLHAVMLTLLAVEARRRTGRSDLVLGTTASVRETAAEARVVGYYVNMLPVPCHVPPDGSFWGTLGIIGETLAAGLQHARYPFARMYREFWNQRPRQRHPARYPLFDLAVTENPAGPPDPALPRLARRREPVDYERTNASPGEDMVLIHEELPAGGLALQWHVNAALYTRETARCWFESLGGWALWLAGDRERAREPLPALLPRESAQLASWEQGARVDRPALRFHELFERVHDRTGQATRPAIVTETCVSTYADLEREANVIAHRLLLCGLAEGAVVAVLTGRSANLPAAILGIWKACATYLPLAADLPADRLAFTARDAGASLLIALNGVAVPPELAHDLPAPLRPEDIDAEFRRSHGYRISPARRGGGAAYIIYTSGSTGRPKGTRIGHAAYLNTVLGTGETIGLTRDDRSLLFSSPSFDVSLSDVGLPLAFGAAMCPVPYEVLSSPNRFRAFLTRLRVTVADITPTYLRLFAGAELPSVRILVTGGEAPFPADVAVYAARHQYFNAYGPTENTITSTMATLSSSGTITGGRPLPNTCVEVCDSEGRPVPPGVVGELWLGGAGLARDYIGRPELSAAAFLDTPRGRRYRSGDLGRWRATGEIEILGRIDDQVKRNGIRIELEEIEHALESHPDIGQAVVLMDGDRGQNHVLRAFVRPLPGRPAPSGEGWAGFLAARLPSYMMPSTVTAVAEIPLSSSGKVDKAALRSLPVDREAADSAPVEGLEKDIARLWSDLLGCGPIHRDDNFFALGGHSLLAIAVAHRLEESLGFVIPARELFAEPTLRGFAQRVSESRTVAQTEAIGSNRATEGQREFWVAEKAGLDTRGFNIPLTLTVTGDNVPTAWATLVARHDALRTSFYEDGDGALRRSVDPDPSARLEISTHGSMDAAAAHIRNRQAEPIGMEHPPLWRAGLAYVADRDQMVFWLALHHSVGDGVSLGILVQELLALLGGDTLARAAPGPFDLSAGKEESYLAGPASREDARFWQRALGGLPDTVFDEWPLDFSRPLQRTGRNAQGAHRFRVRLDASAAGRLRGFARSHGVSLHALMLALVAQEMCRRTRRREFLLGTAASTRDSASEARTIGYYVNMLPIPCRIERHASFEDALRAMQRSLGEGLRHARYPFARMYRDFREDHGTANLHPARYPLFDIAVTENPAADVSTAFGPSDGYELRIQGPAQDMVLVHESQPDGSLVLEWYVNAAIYEKETAGSWIGSLVGWACHLADRNRAPDTPLPALLPEEEARLAAWERGPAVPHPAPSFPALFERWAHIQPSRPVLITDQGTATYEALNARSNALAHALLAAGVGRQEPVGVLTGRSIALFETVLSIWKAGACYLPLANDLPAERLAFIARDAGVRVLVVLDGHELPAALAGTGCRIFRPETLPEAFFAAHAHPVEIAGEAARSSELAYIIYTSGSTGTPKGVMLHHEGLNNLGVALSRALDVRSDDRALVMASPAFDAWISDLAMAWAAGAAVVPVLRSEMEDIAGMRDKVARLGVSIATMTPSYLRLFEQAEFPGLRTLMTVGEPPHPADARHYAATPALHQRLRPDRKHRCRERRRRAGRCAPAHLGQAAREHDRPHPATAKANPSRPVRWELCGWVAWDWPRGI